MQFFLPKQIDEAIAYFEKLQREKTKQVVIFETPKRSKQQNKLLHDNLQILAEYSGYTPQQMKLIIKQDVTDKGILEMVTKTITPKGMEITEYKSSKDLDTKEFQLLMNHIFQLGNRLGLQMHDPDLLQFATDLFS